MVVNSILDSPDPPRSVPRTAAPAAAGADPAPILTSVTPNSGQTTGGTPVTLTGTGFLGATAVQFGTAAAGYTVVSDTEISATSPAGAGTVAVTVTAPSGTSNGVPYTYITIPIPALTSLTPSAGPRYGGTPVTLTGTGLSNVTSVQFGGVPALAFTVVSPTTIAAVAPPGNRTVQVTATSSSGTSNGLPYTYVTAPGLFGVSPDQGPLQGGNTVVLTGLNLSGATAVAFGTNLSPSFTVLTGSQITAVVPPATAPGPVYVTVTTPGGTSPLGPMYYYLQAPALTAAAPAAGPIEGGTAVTLTGAHLSDASAVDFGGIPAAFFSVVSDDRIDAVAPAAVAGTVPITVTTPGGVSGGLPYAYLPAPVVDSVNPASGPASGGNTVNLVGSGLSATEAVTFGGEPASFTALSDNQITAVVPPGPAGAVDVAVTTPGGTSPAVVYTRAAPPAI